MKRKYWKIILQKCLREDNCLENIKYYNNCDGPFSNELILNVILNLSDKYYIWKYILIKI